MSSAFQIKVPQSIKNFSMKFVSWNIYSFQILNFSVRTLVTYIYRTINESLQKNSQCWCGKWVFADIYLRYNKKTVMQILRRDFKIKFLIHLSKQVDELKIWKFSKSILWFDLEHIFIDTFKSCFKESFTEKFFVWK